VSSPSDETSFVLPLPLILYSQNLESAVLSKHKEQMIKLAKDSTALVVSLPEEVSLQLPILVGCDGIA